jgi:hypothetical protein
MTDRGVALLAEQAGVQILEELVSLEDWGCMITLLT